MKFNSLIKLLESPDRSIRLSDVSYETLNYNDDDATTFLIEPKHIIIYGKTESAGEHDLFTHSSILKILKSSAYLDKEEQDEFYKKYKNKNITIIGNPSFKIRMIDSVYRAESLRNYPELLQGRFWPTKNYISFWNSSDYVLKKDSFTSCLKMIKHINPDVNIKNIKWELDDSFTLTTKEVTEKIKNLNKVEDKQIQDWQTVLHTISPEKKGDAMKKLGIKPKKGLDIKDKFLRVGD